MGELSGNQRLRRCRWTLNQDQLHSRKAKRKRKKKKDKIDKIITKTRINSNRTLQDNIWPTDIAQARHADKKREREGGKRKKNGERGRKTAGTGWTLAWSVEQALYSPSHRTLNGNPNADPASLGPQKPKDDGFRWSQASKLLPRGNDPQTSLFVNGRNLDTSP